jgi:hypothetical protein
MAYQLCVSLAGSGCGSALSPVDDCSANRISMLCDFESALVVGIRMSRACTLLALVSEFVSELANIPYQNEIRRALKNA